MVVFARPPQVHLPASLDRRPWRLAAVGTDQRAVEVHVGVARRMSGQQCAV
jgi:hypothetical protein